VDARPASPRGAASRSGGTRRAPQHLIGRRLQAVLGSVSVPLTKVTFAQIPVLRPLFGDAKKSSKMSSAITRPPGADGAAQKRQHVADACPHVRHRHALLQRHRLHPAREASRIRRGSGCPGRLPWLSGPAQSGTGNLACVATWADHGAGPAGQRRESSILFMWTSRICVSLISAGRAIR